MRRSVGNVIGVVLLAWVLTAPGGAKGQGIPSAVEPARDGEEIKGDTGVVDIREVERGLYFSVDFGPNYYAFVDAPGFVRLNEGWLTPGTRMGLRLGYDVLNNVNVELFVLGNFNKGKLSEDALLNGKLTGDVAHFAPGIAARFAFITTDRLFVYGRAGLGYALWVPQGLAEGQLGSVHADASLGIEYYTRLRHISIGAEVAVQGLMLPFAFGVQVYPTIKYTF